MELLYVSPADHQPTGLLDLHGDFGNSGSVLARS